MQLVAYGAQDIYLTGNPQITFFKVVYRRHTNFSMESIKQTFSGSAGFGKDVTATISRNGDLVYRMYLEHACTFKHARGAVDSDVGLVERYGDSLIKECVIEIGGQKIDKHTSMWNRVYSDLTEYNPTGHFGATAELDISDGSLTVTNTSSGTLHQLMTGNGLGLNSDVNPASGFNEFGVAGDNNTVNGFKYCQGDGGPDANIDIGTIFLPLNFWFNRNPGLALPLIALQYHEVKVKMTFEDLSKLARVSDGENFGTVAEASVGSGNALTSLSPTFNLWADYIYLDTDERRRFAQVSHEYLIEQLQISNETLNTASPSISLNFNHPVKELIWTLRNESNGTTAGRCQSFGAAECDFTASPVSIDTFGGNWKLVLNGHDRFKERDSKYFTRTQVWEHHTGYGGVPTFGNAGQVSDENSFDGVQDCAIPCGEDSIAVYSFALKPEEHQPSGTCNFSRIDNAQLVGTNLTVPIGTQQNSGNAQKYTQAAINANARSDNVNMTIFAVNYNVLRIMSGMGGLAYSN